jgi:hypothetical protein
MWVRKSRYSGGNDTWCACSNAARSAVGRQGREPPVDGVVDKGAWAIEREIQ